MCLLLVDVENESLPWRRRAVYSRWVLLEFERHNYRGQRGCLLLTIAGGGFQVEYEY